MVGREKFLGGGEGNGAVARLGAGDDLFDPSKAFEPRLENGSDRGIGMGFGKNCDIAARNHRRRLSEDGFG